MTFTRQLMEGDETPPAYTSCECGCLCGTAVTRLVGDYMFPDIGSEEVGLWMEFQASTDGGPYELGAALFSSVSSDDPPVVVIAQTRFALYVSYEVDTAAKFMAKYRTEFYSFAVPEWTTVAAGLSAVMEYDPVDDGHWLASGGSLAVFRSDWLVQPTVTNPGDFSQIVLDRDFEVCLDLWLPGNSAVLP